jgi:hypothetical protein
MTLLLLLGGWGDAVPDAAGEAYNEEILIYLARLEEIQTNAAQAEELIIYGTQLQEER